MREPWDALPAVPADIPQAQALQVGLSAAKPGESE